MSYPGLAPNETDLRKIVGVVLRLLAGKTNNVTTVTLTANATTTTLTDSRIGGGSYIGFEPTTANAASTRSTLYVSAKDKGTATLTHSNTADVDKTYAVLIVG